MASVVTVGVKELKNRLSEYLRDVRRGAHVLVTDRQVVIAELAPPGAGATAGARAVSQATAWIEAGRLVPPRLPKTPLRTSPVRSPRGTAQALLDALREEGAR
jgi:antitoxin (DNA-binding transcriptional repressor) of toxin-antitoxin stability system